MFESLNTHGSFVSSFRSFSLYSLNSFDSLMVGLLGSSRRCSAHANQERRSRGAYVQPILLNATAHLQTMRVYIGCGSIMVHGFLADGFLADGFLADGFLADGFLADGFLVDDFLADGFFVDRSRFSC